MLKVGLTGGIGSGKSYCANFFRLLGIPIYESDSKAKDLMVHNAKVIEAITDLFGSHAYHDDG
ncbi:MAG: dephospho-CoA kinase, partial [Bacteroidota bacterium]